MDHDNEFPEKNIKIDKQDIPWSTWVKLGFLQGFCDYISNFNRTKQFICIMFLRT